MIIKITLLSSNLEHQLFQTVRISTCLTLPWQYWYQHDQQVAPSKTEPFSLGNSIFILRNTTKFTEKSWWGKMVQLGAIWNTYVGQFGTHMWGNMEHRGEIGT